MKKKEKEKAEQKFLYGIEKQLVLKVQKVNWCVNELLVYGNNKKSL